MGGAGPLLSLPRVSVCVPTHNGAAHVRECLDSVARQTFADWELLVVDDASKDDTLERAAAAAPGLIAVHNPAPLGLPENWNECLRRARGEYVKLLFQDDVLSPDALEVLVAALDRLPEAAAAFGTRELRLEPGGVPFGEAYARELDRFHASAGEIVTGPGLVDSALRAGDLTLNVVGEPSFVLLRRSMALSAGGFDPRFRQLADWEFWLRLARHHPFAFVGRTVGVFRLHPASHSRRAFRSLAVRREIVALLARVAESYGHGLGPEARAALRRARWRYGLRLAVARLGM